MIKNKEDLIKQCNNVFDMFSLHNWHYPFILEWQDKGDRLLTFIGNIRNYYEDSKDEITFTAKEIEILKKNNFSIKDIIYIIQDLLHPEPNLSLLTDLKLNETELQEFKSKLERLV